MTRADPRGPMRTAVAVEPTPSATLVTLSCGHVASLAQHFHYKVGCEYRCHTCGQRDRVVDAAVRFIGMGCGIQELRRVVEKYSKGEGT